MIAAITGNTGGGKSYRAVQMILEALGIGRPVVTNIPLTFEYPLLYAWDWQTLHPSNTVLPYPMGALYILDEAWRMDTIGTPARKNVTLLSFFKEHRHRTNSEQSLTYWQYTDTNKSSIGVSDDIFLVTQDLADINTAVRVLVQRTIICIKPTELAISGASLRMYHEGAVTGVKLVQKKLISQEIEIFKPEVFACYKTDTLGSGQGGHTKENTALQSSVFGSPKFKFFVFLFVSVIIGVIFLIYRINTQIIPKYTTPSSQQAPAQPLPPTQQASAQPLPPTQQAPALPAQQASKPIDSVNWRVSGVVTMKSKNKTVVYISDFRGHVKRINVSSCKHDDFNQYECLLDGNKVTLFTGSYLSSDSSISNAAASIVK